MDRVFTAVPRSAQAARHGDRWCHMLADTRDELDHMAGLIGLKRAYRQDTGKPTEHYDLTPGKRFLALGYGAVAMDSIAAIIDARRDGSMRDHP